MKSRMTPPFAGRPYAVARPAMGGVQPFRARATTKSPEVAVRIRALCEAHLTKRREVVASLVGQQSMMARPNQNEARRTLINIFPRAVGRFIGNVANSSLLPARSGAWYPSGVAF